MAEALAGVRPEATAATLVVEAAAAQARKGPVAMAGSQKNRATSFCVAALKRRSSEARGQSRPLRPPYPHAGKNRGPPDQDRDAIST